METWSTRKRGSVRHAAPRSSTGSHRSKRFAVDPATTRPRIALRTLGLSLRLGVAGKSKAPVFAERCSMPFRVTERSRAPRNAQGRRKALTVDPLLITGGAVSISRIDLNGSATTIKPGGAQSLCGTTGRVSGVDSGVEGYMFITRNTSLRMQNSDSM